MKPNPTFDPKSAATQFVLGHIITNMIELIGSETDAIRRTKLIYRSNQNLVGGVISRIADLYREYGGQSLSPSDNEKVEELIDGMIYSIGY